MADYFYIGNKAYKSSGNVLGQNGRPIIVPMVVFERNSRLFKRAVGFLHSLFQRFVG